MYYRITNCSDELYHYGVLGMHWGVRRYQDYEGRRIGAGEPAETRVTPGMKSGKSFKTTTVGGQGGNATGTARVAATANTGDKKPGMFDRTIKNGKGKENTSPAEEIAKGVRNASRDAKPLVDIAEKHDPKIKEAKQEHAKKAKKETSQMSDQELRDRINRIKMEREYKSLTEPEVETGYDKAREFLEVAGDLASIAVSIATFIAIIHKLRHDDVQFDDDTLAFIEDFENVLAQDGLTLDDISPDFLEHHGIKGMHWGVRRYQDYDGTRINSTVKAGSDKYKNTVVGGQGGKATGTARLAASPFGAKQPKIRADGKDESKFTPQQKQVSRDAQKDAEEFARAKAFYGEGAGNRRKAIKTTVEAKKKKSDFYAEEFEYHLSQQDMEEHMRKAKMERSQKDTAKNTRTALRKTNRALGQLSRYL